MTCLVCSLLAGMGTSAAADDIDDVEFPAGAASFADRVVTVTMEGNPEPAPDGVEALGAPDEHAFGLGNGGRLVVEFVDNVLVPSGDENPDLGVISVAEPAAATTVSVSSDGILWETLGTVDAGRIGIDLDALGFDRDDRFRFVEMVDIAGESGAAEIDAVGAISTMSPSGGVDAIFENPLGGDAMVVTGVGTPVFGWGEALFPNSLQFRAGSYTGGVEREFDLGSLTYFNGTTTSGTTAERVSLAVTLDTGGADEATTFVFQLELQSTPNTGNAFQNADIVRLPNPFSAEEIVVQGSTYRLQLSFEAATAGGVTELDRFFAIEGQTVSAVLRGRLTTESALDGCAPRRLTFDHGNETAPAWNPAGGTIAFATNRNFGRDIGGIEDDRTGERLLAKGMGTGLVGEVLAWQDQWVTTTETRSTHEVLAFDTKREPGDRESFDESEDRGEFLTLLTFSSTGGFFVLSRDGSTALWNDWDGVRSTLRSAGYAVLLGQSASAVGTVLREQLGIGRKAVMHSAALLTVILSFCQRRSWVAGMICCDFRSTPGMRRKS
ncbi:MAG: choice-of-anchor K domain-containing protein [Verrucomicrobia bacterium]|nr:choice-of-anchor K domain-containing protein [Verrucomicrobiota bacterium]